MNQPTQDAQSPRSRCLGVTKLGKPCPYQGVDGGDYCHRHDPARAGDRKAWTTSGGRAKSGGVRALKAVSRIIAASPDAPRSMGEVQQQLGTVMGGVLAGTISPEIAAAYGQLVGRYVQVAQAMSIEVLEQHVRELESEESEAA